MLSSNRKGVIDLDYRHTDEIYHHGIKGQKWGVRRFQNKDGSLTPAGKERYYVDNDSSTAITKNSDGSYTVPTGFKFNRVGQQTLDVNKSGVLYVSYGKEDAARYVKSLGPTLISRLMGGNGQAVQHIEAKKPLRMASEAEVYKGLSEEDFESVINETIDKINRCKHLKETENIRKMYKGVSDDDPEALKIQMRLRDKIKNLRQKSEKI